MKELTMDRKRILDFSSSYISEIKEAAKRRFSEVCNQDETLSKKFREYVSDPEHINVTLRPCYGRAMDLLLQSVHADYSFDYEDSYYKTTGLAGDITFNAAGTAHLSNVHTTGEHRTYTATLNGSTSFFASALSQCQVTLGRNDALMNPQNYIDVTDHSLAALPRKLSALASERVTCDTINEYISVKSLPDHVYAKMKKTAIGNYEHVTNFKMVLTDYRVDELSVTYLPCGYELDIWINYDGKSYSLKNVSGIEKITSNGPHSDHYQEFSEGVTLAKSEYSVHKWPTGKIYAVGTLFTLIVSIALLVFMTTSKNRGNVGFVLMYKREMIAMIVATFLITAVMAVQWFRSLDLSLSYADEKFYDNKTPVPILLERVSNSFKAQKQRSVALACTCLSVGFVAAIVCGCISLNLYKKTNVDNYYYTPEIIQTYEGGNEKKQERLEILSCDDQGNVVAIYTSTYEGTTAKMKYIGKVTRKDYEQTGVTLEFSEWIENPSVGSPEKKMSIYFYKNDYSKILGSLELSAVQK